MTLNLSSRLGGNAAVRQRLNHKQDIKDLSSVLVRSGRLDVQLAMTKKDVRRAQKVRYRVFFEDGGAKAHPTARLVRRDICCFDLVCDHLIVVDNELIASDGYPEIVGVYRLLRQEVAERNFGFYSAREFDVASLVAQNPATRFLEVGRACVAPTHRGTRVLEMLWRGIFAYALHHRMDALLGCASLRGPEPAAHVGAIRMLTGSASNLSLRVAPLNGHACLLYNGEDTVTTDFRTVLRGLPPLVRGYWRLGATFSPVPVVDHIFGTTDLFLVLPLCDIDTRYLRYFGERKRSTAPLSSWAEIA